MYSRFALFELDSREHDVDVIIQYYEEVNNVCRLSHVTRQLPWSLLLAPSTKSNKFFPHDTFHTAIALVIMISSLYASRIYNDECFGCISAENFLRPSPPPSPPCLSPSQTSPPPPPKDTLCRSVRVSFVVV